MKRASLILLAFMLLVAWATPAKAAILGSSENFAVLGASTVTNTGPTIITGDLGLYAGSAVTGFAPPPANTVFGGPLTPPPGPGLVNAPYAIHITDAVAQQAQADNTTAYNGLKNLAATADLTGQDLGGLTLAPGVYFFATSAQLTGTLQLDAQGDDNPVWVFQIGSTLTTASSSVVQIINPGVDGSTAGGLFWQVGSSATLGTTTDFEGSILALASITLQTGATIHNGRAWAQTGAVTMDTNTIDINSPPYTGKLTGGIDFVGGVIVDVDNGQPLGTVPEPGTFLIFGSLVAGLFGFRKRFLTAA
jgi:Ice-binding-like/PEP-CTERM motif